MGKLCYNITRELPHEFNLVQMCGGKSLLLAWSKDLFSNMLAFFWVGASKNVRVISNEKEIND